MNKELPSRASGLTGVTVLRLPAVKSRVSFSKSKIYADIAAGKFPPPIKLGRVSGWIESEIEDFLAAHVVASRSGVSQ
ncbi:helix-turn-helix transcriptional regulator [Pseudoduganella danionis]|uniref:helix-turn-helix transcriptional regulator n=1 Tax=Pseudoduganella danionis TaxID=1890295 RepID=UPI0035B48F98